MPQPTAVEEDLSGISAENLAERRTEIQARVDTLIEADDLSDEALAELESLGDQVERIALEETRRAGEAEERQTRRDAALARVRGDAAGSEPPADEEDQVDDVVDDVAAAATTLPTGMREVEQPGLVTLAAGPNGTRAPSVQGLRGRRPAAVKTRPAAQVAAFAATPATPGVPEGRGMDFEGVANAMARKRTSFGNAIPAGVRDFVSIAVTEKTFTHGIGEDAKENFGVLEQVRAETTALVASGACCTPLTPMYDFCQLAEPQSPVEEGLASVNAPRGGIRYIVPPDFRAARAAIGVQCCVTPPAVNPDKPCLHVDCPAVAEETVCAVSQCLSFDNLQYRTFPEQVANFLETVAVAFASRKEVYYLDYINSHSTSVTGITTGYGLSRNILFNLVTASVAYRKRRGMKRGSTLSLFAPDTLLDEIKLDMAMDGDDGLSYFSITDAQALQTLRDQGLEPVWYNDTPSGLGQDFTTVQAAGNLLKFPINAVMYLFAPGTFVRLDGGSLDLGIVRDSKLNRSNDMEMFMEEWIGMAMLCLESVKLVVPGCPNGARPNYVTPLTCP